MMAPQIHVSFDKGVDAVTIYAKCFSRPTAKGYAPCKFHLPGTDEELRRELDRNIILWKRLHSWSQYFGFASVIPQVIEQLENPPKPSRSVEVYPGTERVKMKKQGPRDRQAECVEIIEKHWPEMKPLLEDLATLEPMKRILRDGQAIVSFQWNKKAMKAEVTCEPPIVDCFENR